MNDVSAYYLLGYSSTNPAQDGRYRKIDVKVAAPERHGARAAGVRLGEAGARPRRHGAGGRAPRATGGLNDALSRWRVG